MCVVNFVRTQKFKHVKSYGHVTPSYFVCIIKTFANNLKKYDILCFFIHIFLSLLLLRTYAMRTWITKVATPKARDVQDVKTKMLKWLMQRTYDWISDMFNHEWQHGMA